MTAIDTARALAREVTDLLAKADEVRQGRDKAIRYGHNHEGATIADLSRATGLTRTMLYKILERDPGR